MQREISFKGFVNLAATLLSVAMMLEYGLKRLDLAGQTRKCSSALPQEKTVRQGIIDIDDKRVIPGD